MPKSTKTSPSILRVFSTLFLLAIIVAGSWLALNYLKDKNEPGKIYGCDDCQTCCPWNKFAVKTQEKAFYARKWFKPPELIKLFSWSEKEFLSNAEGSSIRRIGYECWLRNIAVALGNSEKNSQITAALKSRLNYPSEIVQEHVGWALNKLF